MKESFSVQLNPSNPAEFFSACGLLELAGIQTHAEGKFGVDNVFHLYTETDGDPVSAALHMLKAAGNALPVTDNENSPKSDSPLKASPPVDIRLDWWADNRGLALKTFAGRQGSTDIYSNLLRETAANLSKEKTGLDLWNAVSAGVKGLGLDIQRSWTPLNMGFSLNKLPAKQQSPPCRPAIELLSVIGLQRMRPILQTNPGGIEYWTWDAPLSPLTAGAAVAGQIEFAKLRKYRADFQMLGKNKNYKVAEDGD